MPTTADQQSLDNIIASYNQYLNPQYYQGADNPALHYSQGTPATNILGQSGSMGGATSAGLDLALASIGGIPFISKLFGKKAQSPQFQPYQTGSGNYQWTDPSIANAIPYTNLPGAHVLPTPEYTQLADQVRAITDLLPQYSQAISAQKVPDALGQLAADTSVTGPRLALQQQLQEQYGPIFDQLAAESNLRKSTSSAQNDLSVLQGPGKDLVSAAQDAAKLYDPEYFKTRADTSDSLGKLLGQTTANLGTGMTNTERDEVGRSLALSADRNGTANSPSQLDTVGNAMAFGAAGRARENDSQNQLSKAIAASTAFLPQSRSNVDVFQVATGRPSYNQNDSRFNTTNATGDATSSANALLNTGTSMWTTNQNNALTKQLNATNWMDTLGAITGAIGSVGGAVGGIAACWVAREVYGIDNPKWLQFRHWLLNTAPKWFMKLYLKYGERFAAFISNKPKLKFIIRMWMNGRIK